MRLQADHRTLPTHHQAPAHVTQEQAEVAQALAQGLFQRRLLDQPTTDQGETAQRHAVAVEVEEFVAQVFNEQQPQPCERPGRHPCIGCVHHRRVDARLHQQRTGARRLLAQCVQHDVHEVHRDRIVFPHDCFRYAA